MDPVRILDHYRLPLVTSGESIQLLALLLRDGPQAVADLATSLNTGVGDVIRSLTNLYSAAFVEHRNADLWSIAHLGEQVMENLKVVDLASVDLVKTLAEAPSDKLFLIQWLERPSDLKDSRTCLSLLRSLNQVKKLHHDQAARPEDPSALLYAILIACDSGAQDSGVDNVAGAISRRLESWFLSGTQLSSAEAFNVGSVESAWREGMHKYIGSNDLLLYIPNGSPSPTDPDTIQFTWLRALGAALGGTADRGFSASCRSWQRHHADLFWSSMFEHGSFEKDTRTMLERWTGFHEPATEDLLTELTDRLLLAVGSAPADRWLSIAAPEPSAQDDFDALASMLRLASQRIRLEGFHVMPGDTQEVLRAALAEFTDLFPTENDPRPPIREVGPSTTEPRSRKK